MQRLYWSARIKLGLALGFGSLTSIGFFVFSSIVDNDTSLWYLPWNLFLAWIPLGLAVWVEAALQKRAWSSWYALGVTCLWLAFLPNSFYMVSDLIHLQGEDNANVLIEVITFMSFIANGLLLGFASLAIVHRQLVGRLAAKTAAILIGAVLFLCSFAIYIGRELRWNSWDILTNPASLLVDVSERLIHFSDHPEVATVTGGFFILLAGMYAALWYLGRVVQPAETPAQR